MIKKILMNNEDVFYWSKGDFHTNSGMIKEKDILKKNLVKTNLGKEFFVLDARFIDKMQRIKRAPQAILEKDIASILLNISLENDANVLEAGSGSGKLTAFLAKAVPNGTVHSYEIRNDFLDIAKKNLDAVILDLPEPWRALKQAEKALKNGCFLVAYLPSITQVIEFVRNIDENKHFIFIKTIEI